MIVTDQTNIKANTIKVYDRQAQAWDVGRDSKLRERPWFDTLLKGLIAPLDMLGLGCGTGRPIASYLLGQGHRVTGIDASAEMIALAQKYHPAQDHPNARWLCKDMRALGLDKRFDIVLSWDGFFHLSPAEQRDVLPKLCQLLRPAGRLMLTIGHEAGEAIGQVYGDQVYHGSLSHPEYLEILTAADMHNLSITSAPQNGLDRVVVYATKQTTQKEG